jgi:hypothetical protein
MFVRLNISEIAHYKAKLNAWKLIATKFAAKLKNERPKTNAPSWWNLFKMLNTYTVNKRASLTLIHTASTITIWLASSYSMATSSETNYIQKIEYRKHTSVSTT